MPRRKQAKQTKSVKRADKRAGPWSPERRARHSEAIRRAKRRTTNSKLNPLHPNYKPTKRQITEIAATIIPNNQTKRGRLPRPHQQHFSISLDNRAQLSQALEKVLQIINSLKRIDL